MVEPLLGIEAPLQEAQVLESRLINLLHFQTLIAKAARMVLPAPGARSGGRPAAASAAYLAGFTGTARTRLRPSSPRPGPTK